MIEVSVNHLLLQIESNSFNDSCMRFYSKIIYIIKVIQDINNRMYDSQLFHLHARLDRIRSLQRKI